MPPKLPEQQKKQKGRSLFEEHRFDLVVIRRESSTENFRAIREDGNNKETLKELLNSALPTVQDLREDDRPFVLKLAKQFWDYIARRLDSSTLNPIKRTFDILYTLTNILL
jgi:hypothetical protein